MSINHMIKSLWQDYRRRLAFFSSTANLWILYVSLSFWSSAVQRKMFLETIISKKFEHKMLLTAKRWSILIMLAQNFKRQKKAYKEGSNNLEQLLFNNAQLSCSAHKCAKKTYFTHFLFASLVLSYYR